MEYEVIDRVVDGVEFRVGSLVDVAAGRLFWGGRAILDVRMMEDGIVGFDKC